MKDNIVDVTEIKVTIIGSQGVGKTCIIKNYVEGVFSEYNISTSGVDYYKKELIMNNKKVILNIWDTAGQEKFYSMAQYFYRNSFILLIRLLIFNKFIIFNLCFNDITFNLSIKIFKSISSINVL